MRSRRISKCSNAERKNQILRHFVPQDDSTFSDFANFVDTLKALPDGRAFNVCFYMMIAFLGQTPAQVPQATQASSSRVQVLAARSTVSAPAGHFLAQIVQ